MLRMEIALFLVIGFIACVYFSAGRKITPLNRTFSVLLVVVLIHLGLDGVTVYTVHHLETVPRVLNDAVHRLFLGSKVLLIYLFNQNIENLLAEREIPTFRPACRNLFSCGSIRQFPFADFLHGDPERKLFFGSVYDGALRGCCVLSVAVCRTFDRELAKD